MKVRLADAARMPYTGYMTKLTQDAVTTTLEQIVAEYGEDYVYPDYRTQCNYAEQDEDGNVAPSCIVGHVFSRLAPELFSRLADYESGGDDSLTVNEVFSGTRIKDDTEISDEVLAGLHMAQRVQDRGETWGVALERYKDTVANPYGD